MIHQRQQGAADDGVGVSGGSGLYEIAGLKNAAWRRVASPFGETSDEFLFGVLDGLDVVFVPRHGRGHRHSPTRSTTAPTSMR